MSRSIQLHYIPVTAFINLFIFISNFQGMRLPWEFHDQPQETNWRHCVTGPELPFFHKERCTKNRSVCKNAVLCMGVACSYSLAPGHVNFFFFKSWHSDGTAEKLGFGQVTWVTILGFWWVISVILRQSLLLVAFLSFFFYFIMKG